MTHMLRKAMPLALSLTASLGVFAAPITAPQAKVAVAKWLADRPAAHMEAKFTSGVKGVETVRDDGGEGLFHIVTLEGGGFVVTSSDDDVQPIIAFSDSGTMEKSDDNPMWAMLSRDLPGRMAAVRQVAAAKAAAASSGAVTASTLTASMNAARDEWADLLSAEEDDVPAGAVKAGNVNGGRSSLTDVRVSPLVQTKWSQSLDSSGSGNCYNLYTPNNYVCGCVATAGAQVMKYWAYPTSSVGAETFSCWVGSTVTSKTMYGGTYNWSSMPNTPNSSTTTAQRQAIGKLCYDVGVATRMQWTSGGSGACPAVLAQSLVSVFGYASAKCHMHNAFDDALYRRAIYANLDAGCPVLLGIYGTRISNTSATVGHEIVADGYGVYNSTVYTHLNMGWAGLDDAWYALPTIYADGNDCSFTTIGSVVYNIFTQESGELVTGRITDASGSPMAGVTVTARNGSTAKQATTNAKGIYSLKVAGGQTWELTASKSGYQERTASVSVSTSSSSTLAALNAGSYSYYMNGTVGNSWGNDFTLVQAASKPNLRIGKCVLSSAETTYEDVVAQTEFAKGESILFYTGWENAGEAAAAAPFVVRHEVLSSSGTVLGTYNHTQAEDHGAGYTIYWTAAQWSALQGLAVGTYRYRVTLDPDGQVDESSESDNVATVTFAVVESEEELTTVTIDGPSTLEPGESAAYVGRAYLADGTIVTVDPVWTIDSGSSYATLGSDGVLRAGVHSVSRSVVIRATCTYNGTVRSATKTVAIRAAISLPVAVDSELTFATSGDAVWYGQTTASYDGVDAARSGVVGNNQSSYMETTVTGPGTLSYWYKVSSEAGYDKFTCSLNGTVVLTESGTDKDWCQHSIELPDAAECTIRWSYAKDVSLAYGDDCVYIDKMVWTPAATPTSLTIGGASSVSAGSGVQLSCTAHMSDGTSKAVVPAWSISSGGAYGAISASGYLTTYASTVARSIVVMAQYEEGDVVKTASKTISVTAVIPLPDAPVITKSGIGSSSGAIIAWNAAANASTYRVYRSEGASSRPASPIASQLTARTYTDTSALPGVSYTYWVSAVNVTGEAFSAPEEAYRVVTLVANPVSMTFEYDGQPLQAVVKSNASWTYSADQGWLSFSRSGEVLTVMAEENADEDPRSCVITVTAAATADYPKSIEIVVSQNGRPPAEAEGTPDFVFMKTLSGDADYALYATSAETGIANRLFDCNAPIFLRWGWGNAGTGGFEGGVLSEIQLAAPGARAVWQDFIPEDVELGVGEGVSNMIEPPEWMYLDPGIYIASVLLDSNNSYDEIEKENNYAEFRFAVRDAVELSEALDCEAFAFATVEDDWYGTAGIGSDGEDCAMTRLLGDGGTNTLTATVSAAGTISFAYMTSTESGYDVFRFLVDDEVRLEDSGIGSWKTVSFEVGEGMHTFTWQYGKDGKGTAGDDCVYLDRVAWKIRRPDAPPANFQASDGTEYNSVKLTWSKLDDAVSYVIQRAESSDGPWSDVYDGAYATKVSDTTALGSVTYCYRIKAVYPESETQWSAVETGYRAAYIGTSSARWVPGSGGADGFNLDANGPWTVTANRDWITMDMTNGVGACKFWYRFEANPNESQREASLTFVCSSGESGTGRSYSRTVTIYQRPRIATGGAISLNEAANTELALRTTEDAPWIGQLRISHDGNGSIRSGDIGAYATSRVETVVATGGTLSFWWGTSCEERDTLTFYVDGVATNRISGYTNSDLGKTNVLNWTFVEIAIPEGGAVLAWEYVKDYITDKAEDAGFVDQISWTPAEREIMPPDEWWNRYPDLLGRLGTNDRSQALRMRSPGSAGSGGKTRRDGTPMTVLDDYVAGTDPTDSSSIFTATIELVDGVPVVKWTPALSESETMLRNYTIYGKKDLQDGAWAPVAEGHAYEFNFFHVAVELK